jgi:histidyl-tRNA synthetase
MKFQPPRGTRDLAPEEMIRREYIFNVIKDVFEKYGFDPLETPAFESWELLSRKGGGGDAIKDEIYYFKDKSERELGLRFDLTVPLARFVANNPQLPKPFKRYQIGRVWRYDRPQAGRFREFWQADIDIVGSSKMDCEVECLAAVCGILEKLGFKNFFIRLNNRKILNGLVKYMKIKEEKATEIFRSLDKIEKIGKEGVKEELEKIIPQNKAIELMTIIETSGKIEDIESKLKCFVNKSKELKEGISELKEIIRKSKLYDINNKIKIDLSLVRGLDYYTSSIFEITVKTKKNVGSISGGGRYDKLIGLYGGQSLPAVGISLGVDRIYEIMISENMFNPSPTKTQVFVVCVNDNVRKDCINIVRELRRYGINTQIDLMGRDIKKQLTYVNSKRIPYALIVGPKEIKEKTYTLRDMKTGKEERVKLKDIKTKIEC